MSDEHARKDVRSSRTLTWQGIRYIAVGALNVGFTLSAFWVLDHLYSRVIGVQAVYWISAILGIISGFVWQRLLVWRSRNRWHREFVRFLAVNLLVSATNSALLLVAVDLWHLTAFPSQVAITGVLLVVSFTLARAWVFRTEVRQAKSAPLDEATRVDVFLQYYSPHISGLTNMARDIADHMARDGLDVRVHCVATDRATRTDQSGVRVEMYRRSFSIGRATFSWGLLRAMWRLRNRPGIAHVHLPYPESALLAALFSPEWRFLVTYQCDAPMTGGTANIIARLLDASHRALLRRASAVATTSDDYAEHSRLRGVLEHTHRVAIPGTNVDRRGGTPRFAEPGRRLIGFLGRPTSEKGVNVLLAALERLPEDVCLLLAGPVEGLSEQPSFDRPQVERLIAADRIRSIGFIEDADLPDFYASLDLFVLPSTNSFEAFGIVQVEAMSAGTPVVASNLPGVRTIVQATGFGRIAAVGDAVDLADAIAAALGEKFDRSRARSILEREYLSPRPEQQYDELLQDVLRQAVDA